MNGYLWHIKFVNPMSSLLVDRTNSLRVATTDTSTKCIYLSSELKGDFLKRVLVHELGHCAIYSFDLDYEIHKVVRPDFWIEAEEWICNFIADYGLKILDIASSVFGDDAWRLVPSELEKLIA